MQIITLSQARVVSGGYEGGGVKEAFPNLPQGGLLPRVGEQDPYQQHYDLMKVLGSGEIPISGICSQFPNGGTLELGVNRNNAGGLNMSAAGFGAGGNNDQGRGSTFRIVCNPPQQER